MSDRAIRADLARVLARLESEARAAGALARRCRHVARDAGRWGLAEDVQALTEKARLHEAKARALEASGAGIRAGLAG